MNLMSKQIKFLFRDHDGKIRSAVGENATQALGSFGNVLSWDDCLTTVEIIIHGKIHRWEMTGSVTPKKKKPRVEIKQWTTD
jgi:hypothetical protein